MAELPGLLLKAIRSLPPDEQDAILRELLAGALWAGAGSQTPTQPSLSDWLSGSELTEELAQLPVHLSMGRMAREAGRPLQTVPVRLPVEQYDRLKGWCQGHGFTMAVVLRGLVARFLDEQDRRAQGTTDA
jgi:hypothetical protein